MKLAVVGATGLVGNVMLKVLAEQKVEFSELILVASEKSVGKQIEFRGEIYTVIGLKDAVAKRPDIALFSAGGDTSLEWAPKFAEVGTTVIDNSSAWRMDPTKKLIIPEVNADCLTEEDKIIANPNCSTIQMVMVLAPLYKKYGIKRIVVSTYQSITGTGVKAVNQLENEYKGIQGEMAYPFPIHRNAIPQCDVFEENGYTKEEMKLVRETQKILANPDIAVTATAIRVPVVGGHSESVNVQLEKPFEVSDIRKILHETEGVIVQDNPATQIYPMPLYAHGKDDVFVGRIRKDNTVENGLNLWVVADNLRKGAATNAVQIAQYLIANKLVSNQLEKA
ncbi:MAG: aspartate-semialdehyde dehydrogenase [Flavobacteriales bacterium CG_4_9_14_3_um_filter_40_17]|nr:MAG: aspartate-semialdehyde dehydrogenase [Flavobacteriales bacterium CG_4_9_14_3_um_filter_40_17]